jgi:hypothetical protein
LCARAHRSARAAHKRRAAVAALIDHFNPENGLEKAMVSPMRSNLCLRYIEFLKIL